MSPEGTAPSEIKSWEEQAQPTHSQKIQHDLKLMFLANFGVWELFITSVKLTSAYNYKNVYVIF